MALRSNFLGGVCSVSPLYLAPRTRGAGHDQEFFVGQAGTLTALVLGGTNLFRWKKGLYYWFLVLDKFNSPVKRKRSFWSQPVTLAFQRE